MQYKFGSAARRGRAFMDLNGPWLIDGTNAPDVHWDWNIQGMYYMPFLTNRPAIANSLVDYVEGEGEAVVTACVLACRHQIHAHARMHESTHESTCA